MSDIICMCVWPILWYVCKPHYVCVTWLIMCVWHDSLCVCDMTYHVASTWHPRILTHDVLHNESYAHTDFDSLMWVPWLIRMSTHCRASSPAPLRKCATKSAARPHGNLDQNKHTNLQNSAQSIVIRMFGLLVSAMSLFKSAYQNSHLSLLNERTLSSALVVHINQKGVYGVRNPPPRNCWCGTPRMTTVLVSIVWI